jgi:hypothetical protein
MIEARRDALRLPGGTGLGAGGLTGPRWPADAIMGKNYKDIAEPAAARGYMR